MTSKSIEEVRIRLLPDADPDVSWLSDAQRWENDDDQAQDMARLEAFRRGEWHMVGVDAAAIIDVNGVRQTVESGGLWNIESDGGEHLADVGREEWQNLRAILLELGFSPLEVDEAAPASFAPAEYV